MGRIFFRRAHCQPQQMWALLSLTGPSGYGRAGSAGLCRAPGTDLRDSKPHLHCPCSVPCIAWTLNEICHQESWHHVSPPTQGDIPTCFLLCVLLSFSINTSPRSAGICLNVCSALGTRSTAWGTGLHSAPVLHVHLSYDTALTFLR